MRGVPLSRYFLRIVVWRYLKQVGWFIEEELGSDLPPIVGAKV